MTTGDDAPPGDAAVTEQKAPAPTQESQPSATPSPSPSPTPTPTPAPTATPMASTAPSANPAATTSAPAAAAAATTPAEQPAATPTQVAQAVSRDFGTYDTDADGKLTQAEFGSWMGKLRKASEPSFQPGTPDAETWIGQAFAASDTDKNQMVDQTELTAFLTPKAS